MTTYKVYWTEMSGNIFSKSFECIAEALSHSEAMRNLKHSFVSMSCENTDLVGQLGVSAVVNGKLPSGEDYTWKKRRL